MLVMDAYGVVEKFTTLSLTSIAVSLGTGHTTFTSISIIEESLVSLFTIHFPRQSLLGTTQIIEFVLLSSSLKSILTRLLILLNFLLPTVLVLSHLRLVHRNSSNSAFFQVSMLLLSTFSHLFSNSSHTYQSFLFSFLLNSFLLLVKLSFFLLERFSQFLISHR